MGTRRPEWYDRAIEHHHTEDAMLPEVGRVGPIVIRTYALLLNLAIVAGLAMVTWAGYRRGERAAHWLDAGLGGVIGGIVAGRLGHVALHWGYFQQHRPEVWQIWRGGLDWHLALAGGLMGLALVGRLRELPLRELLDVAALMLPVGVILTYTGCLSTSCGHGAAVESLAAYPVWMVAELPDLFGVVEPRFASQAFGVMLGVLMLVTVISMARFEVWPGRRLWPLLMMLGAGAFGIGFVRGDAVPMIGVLRIDQILDLTIVVFGLVSLIRSPRSVRSLPELAASEISS